MQLLGAWTLRVEGVGISVLGFAFGVWGLEFPCCHLQQDFRCLCGAFVVWDWQEGFRV